MQKFRGFIAVEIKPFPKFLGFATANEPFGPPSMKTFEYVTIPQR